MIVGVGRIPQKLLEELRKLIDDSNIYLYPEFFDDKRCLVNKRYIKYIERLLEERKRVIVALWPDYLYDDVYGLCSYSVVWIFPLHSLSEADRLPHCIDVLGIPGTASLRDYSLPSFVKLARELGLDMWWLGANRREIPIAIELGFWGLDVNTGSTGLPYARIRDPSFARYFASFLKRVANNELRARQRVLLEWI